MKVPKRFRQVRSLSLNRLTSLNGTVGFLPIILSACSGKAEISGTGLRALGFFWRVLCQRRAVNLLRLLRFDQSLQVFRFLRV